MQNQDLETATKLKQRLLTLIPLVDIRIFGSRARGDAHEHSDMDIFIEVENVTESIKNIIAETAWEIGFEKLIHISPLVYSRDEIENTPLRSSQILKNILKEGVKL